MMLGERCGLGHQLRDPPRPIRPARDRRRAEGAVLVAAVLDLEPAAGVRRESPQHGVHPRRLEPGGLEHWQRVGAPPPRAHGRKRRDRAAVARRGAAHHHGFEPAAAPAPAPAPREPAYQAPEFRLALVGYRAGIHDREVRGSRVVHHDDALVRERLTHERRVVLVGLAAEGMEVDVHGRTVSPTSTVHTRSMSPPPRRSSRSRPRSMSARPCANARPVPSDPATSVRALVPGPNGICPPRAPRRIGIRREPNSAPADQLHVSNAPTPARDQERHTADAATRALGLGANSRPPPAIRGRSVIALVVSATLARSRLSLRAHPAMLKPGATPMSTLPDTPRPS